MPEAWRIVKAKHDTTAFSGKGAAEFGGRWNSRGIAVVYVSQTKSLSALECLLHLNPRVRFKFSAFRVQIQDAWIEWLPAAKLPRNWRVEPPPASTRRIGDLWVREARSPVLAVPSTIIPSEVNFVLNPAHPDFKSVVIGPPEPFTFDPRLLT